MKPLKFEVEYQVSYPPWKNRRPQYTARILLDDPAILKALGYGPNNKSVPIELGHHFWDWRTLQSWIAQKIMALCEQIIECQLPSSPPFEANSSKFTCRVIVGNQKHT